MKIRKCMILVAFLTLALTGCSQATTDKLARFNYLEFTEHEVILKHFSPIAGVRPEDREFDDQVVEMGYEIHDDQRLEFAFGTYALDIKKSEMILENEDFTLHYKKDSSK